MSDPVSGDITYANNWISQQFTTLANNFGRLQICCLQAGLNFTSIMSEPDFPNATEELVTDLCLDAIATVPGLVFIKYLHELEERKLVHQVALAAERISKVIESVADVSKATAALTHQGADQIRTAALKKVMEKVMAELDAAKNRVNQRQKRLINAILEHRAQLPRDFKLQVLQRVVRIDDLSKVQAKNATTAYEERIFRFWAKQQVVLVKCKTVLTNYGNRTLPGSEGIEFQGYKFNEKQLDYIKETFEVTRDNMAEKWGVKVTEHVEQQGYYGGY